jgi:tetratricopeptide (TPR) repeat protein
MDARMSRCEKCGSFKTFFSRSFIYPGNAIGSFEITEAKPICSTCVSKMREDPSAHGETSSKMIKCIEKEQYGEYLKIIEENFNTENPSHWYNRGNALRNLQRFDEALDCFNQALFLDTHYIKAWYRKGQTLFYDGKYSVALTSFGNVVQLDKKYQSGWGVAAKFYIMMTLSREYSRLMKENKMTQEFENYCREWIHHLYFLLHDELSVNADEKIIPVKITPEEFLDYSYEHFEEILTILEPVKGPIICFKSCGKIKIDITKY